MPGPRQFEYLPVTPVVDGVPRWLVQCLDCTFKHEAHAPDWRSACLAFLHDSTHTLFASELPRPDSLGNHPDLGMGGVNASA